MFEIWLYHEEWGGHGVLVLLFDVLVLFIMRLVFLTTLQRIIEQMNVKNVGYAPVWNWISILPLVHYIFDFFLIFKYRQLLRSELEERGMPLRVVNHIFGFGSAYCILNAAMVFDHRLFRSPTGILAQGCGLVCLLLLMDIRSTLKRQNRAKGTQDIY